MDFKTVRKGEHVETVPLGERCWQKAGEESAQRRKLAALAPGSAARGASGEQVGTRLQPVQRRAAGAESTTGAPGPERTPSQPAPHPPAQQWLLSCYPT